MRARLLVIAGAASLALASAAPAAAESPNGPSANAAKAKGTVAVGTQINRFAVQGRRIVGRGVLTAAVVDGEGNVRRTRAPVTFGVTSARRTCRVLTLQLDDLQLTLLGLRVDASEINLRIRGITRGQGSGVLGRLFCRLSRATIRLRGATRASGHARKVVRSLNSRLERRPMRAFRAKAVIQPSARASQEEGAPSCDVLRLVLGPLDLNLLGLVVELFGPSRNSPVIVTIEAFEGRGELGDLFCSLAGGPR